MTLSKIEMKQIKRNAQFVFLCNPQNSSVNASLMRGAAHKKCNCVFLYPRCRTICSLYAQIARFL